MTMLYTTVNHMVVIMESFALSSVISNTTYSRDVTKMKILQKCNCRRLTVKFEKKIVTLMINNDHTMTNSEKNPTSIHIVAVDSANH